MISCPWQIILMTLSCPWILHHNLLSASFPFLEVSTCPKNLTQLKAASQRLNCTGVDHINAYHCLPLSNLSQLVEFCYDKRSGLVEKGNCMVLQNQYLDNRPCNHFTVGCPSQPYLPKNVFAFPACTNINKENRCYISDPTCAPIHSQSNDIELNRYEWVAPAVIIPIGLILTFILWKCKCFRKIRKRKCKDVNDEVEIPLITVDKSQENVDKYIKDEGFRARYRTYLKEGSTDVCPISQILIVGENGVGKTTLLYRLQDRSQDEIDEIKSTVGVECHTKKDSFIVMDGKLMRNLKEEHTLTINPSNVISESPSDRSSKKSSTKKDKDFSTKESTTDGDVNLSSEEKNITLSKKESLSTVDVNLSSPLEEKSVSTHDHKSGNGSEAFSIKDNKNNGKKIPKQTTTLKDMIDQIDIIVKKMDETPNIMDPSGYKDRVVLNVLDFAGQGAYYASHQTYLRKDAIYIIVFDTSRDITGKNQQIEKQTEYGYLCDGPKSLFSNWSQKDYAHYWLNTMRTHGGKCDNVIIVGTHGNKRRSDFNFPELFGDLGKLLPRKRCEVILDLCNWTEKEKEGLDFVKTYICQAVSESTKISVPAKWIRYEHIFENIKSDTHVISDTEILKIIDYLNFEMGHNEISDMLNFFHESGHILFFNTAKLRDLIILDIQWFVDCFKHIITDPEHIKEEKRIVDAEVEQKWRYFFQKGFLEESLYESLIEAKTENLSKKQRKILGKYQKKLGMMFHIKHFQIEENVYLNGWYVPCVNTEEFEPNKDDYESSNASSIVCFRFEDYLPIDLFGRLIVLCLDSGNWKPYGDRLCKSGAHMHYESKGKDSAQVYLFTSTKIITVQMIGKKNQETSRHIMTEIQNIIQQLLWSFYPSSTDFKVGFICSKKEGYNENSVKHCIIKGSYCNACKRCFEEETDSTTFWGCKTEQKLDDDRSKQTSKIAPLMYGCCNVYFEVLDKFLKHLRADMDDFGSLYITMLKKNPTKISTKEFESLPEATEKSPNADLKRLHRLFDVGQKLKTFQAKGEGEQPDQRREEIMQCAKELKRIYLSLEDEDENIRRDMFYLWIDHMGDIEKLWKNHSEILLISLTLPRVEYGAEVKLEASVDVHEYDYLWLKKGNLKNKFKILEMESTCSYKRENKILLHIRKFSPEDVGHYQLVVATRNAVGQTNFQLSSEKTLQRDIAEVDKDVLVKHDDRLKEGEITEMIPKLDSLMDRLDHIRTLYRKVKVRQQMGRFNESFRAKEVNVFVRRIANFKKKLKRAEREVKSYFEDLAKEVEIDHIEDYLRVDESKGYSERIASLEKKIEKLESILGKRSR